MHKESAPSSEGVQYDTPAYWQELHGRLKELGKMDEWQRRADAIVREITDLTGEERERQIEKYRSVVKEHGYPGDDIGVNLIAKAYAAMELGVNPMERN